MLYGLRHHCLPDAIIIYLHVLHAEFSIYRILSSDIHMCTMQLRKKKKNLWPSQTQTRSDDHIISTDLLWPPPPAQTSSLKKPLPTQTLTTLARAACEMDIYADRIEGDSVRLLGICARVNKKRSKIKLQYNEKRLSLKTAGFFFIHGQHSPTRTHSFHAAKFTI